MSYKSFCLSFFFIVILSVFGLPCALVFGLYSREVKLNDVNVHHNLEIIKGQNNNNWETVGIPPHPAGRSNLIRLDLIGAKRRNDKIIRVPDARLFFSHGVSSYSYFMGIVKKSVADCIRNRRLAKNFIPLFESKLACNNCRAG